MINEHEVIVIKDDDESQDCNHRISYLRSQRFCQRNAKLCRQVCVACEKHGNPSLKKEHTHISVDNFTKAFNALEETCSKETQHYIRQMNETQQKAIEAIRKKKEEFFAEIQQIKVHLMKKTYRTLEEKYPTLYQKFKNNRLDTIKCCQVFWVINTHPASHQIKHSEINKKLEAILKKFENFKEVSRNINGENIFNNKERVKKSKIAQKINKPEEHRVQKEDIKIDREKVNFYSEAEEKYKREIDKLSRQLASFRERKKNAEQELRRLDYQIRQFNFLRLKKTRKLGIVKGVVNEHNSAIDIGPHQLNQIRPEPVEQPPIASKQAEIENEPEIDEFLGFNTSQENHSQDQMQEENPDESEEPVKEKKVSPQKQHQKIDMENNSEEHAEVVPFQPNLRKGGDRQSQEGNKQAEEGFEDFLSSQQQEERVSEIIPMPTAQEVSKPTPQQIVIPTPQKVPISTPQQVAIPTPIPTLQQAPIQAEVKVEQNSTPFEAWKNAQLLSQMRTYGKRVQHALKVEDIDVLSTLPFITPPKYLFKLAPQKQSALISKPTTFNMMADKLFMKYSEGKKGQDKDKPE